MRKAPRPRFSYLLPSWRRIPTLERESKHQRGGLSSEILAGHPHPGKGLASSERDLTLAHAKLCGPDGFHSAAHGLEDPSGIVLPREELIQGRHVFLRPAIATTGSIPSANYSALRAISFPQATARSSSPSLRGPSLPST